jgi:hypothetical protein
VKKKTPGMMFLIGFAITVAYVYVVAAVIVRLSSIISPLQHLRMVFGIIVYKFAGDGMMAPGEHGAVRRFFDIAFGIGFCCVEVVLCRLGVVRRCLLMIVNGFLVFSCQVR